MDPIAAVLKVVYSSVLHAPNLQLRAPTSLLNLPKWTIFLLAYVSYFFVLSGIVYDIINEPPSMGSVRDEKGRQRFVKYTRHVLKLLNFY